MRLKRARDVDAHRLWRVSAIVLLGVLLSPGLSCVTPPLAFPGAQGFGAFTAGGRGGQVLKVTTLEDGGPGSLRWALEDVDHPRTVLFDTGGIIDLERAIDIDSPHVTIAGQTAPGGGITVRGARIRVGASDVIIRGLRVRPGSGAGAPGDQRDGISIGTPNATVSRVIIDHCSLTWATDENSATWYSVRGVTFSYNLIAEGLRDSMHPQGPHSMGMLLGADSNRVSVVRNLFAHNASRNPLIKQGLRTEIINNFVYNYRTDGVQVIDGSSPSTVHVIGNDYRPGVNTIERPPVKLSSVASDYHLAGNIGIGRPMDRGPEAAIAHGSGVARVRAGRLFVPSGVELLHVDDVRAHVTEHAGARWPTLDAVDRRIVSESLSGTGSVIDSPNERGGYPAVARGSAMLDGDGDGMPTAFENAFGFDPSTPDGHFDSDADGYTNLEEYINGIISGYAPAGP